MSIDGFVEEISSLNERRQEDERWRERLDNHRNVIECFIVSNADLIKHLDAIIRAGESEYQSNGLTSATRHRFTEMSKNTTSWQLGIELVSRSASQYADRINQMIGSNVNLSDVAAQVRGEYVEREQLMANSTPMMHAFIDTSTNLIRALGQIMEIIEGEYKADGLTSRVGRRLGEMADDSEHVKRTLDLIPRVLSGFLDRVQRINNPGHNEPIEDALRSFVQSTL